MKFLPGPQTQTGFVTEAREARFVACLVVCGCPSSGPASPLGSRPTAGKALSGEGRRAPGLMMSQQGLATHPGRASEMRGRGGRPHGPWASRKDAETPVSCPGGQFLKQGHSGHAVSCYRCWNRPGGAPRSGGSRRKITLLGWTRDGTPQCPTPELLPGRPQDTTSGHDLRQGQGDRPQSTGGQQPSRPARLLGDPELPPPRTVPVAQENESADHVPFHPAPTASFRATLPLALPTIPCPQTPCPGLVASSRPRESTPYSPDPNSSFPLPLLTVQPRPC